MKVKDNPKILVPGKWHAEFDEKGELLKVVFEESFRKLLGYTDEEYPNTKDSFEKSIHPDDRENAATQIKNLQAKHPEGLDYDVEYRLLTKNGYRWFHIYGLCSRNEEGILTSCNGVIFDIQNTMDEYANIAKQTLISENNARVLTLEDNFEALYDVDLETENYEVYIKGKNFIEVNSRLINQNKFFSELRNNVELVIYPKDKENILRILTPDNVQKVLENDTHFDWYYRLFVKEKPLWYRMRIMYKDAQKKHIIVGIFNAENERHTMQLAKFKVVAEAVGSAFSSMYCVNLDKDTFQIFKSHEKNDTNDTLINETKPYSHIINKLIDAKVDPLDRQRIKDILAPDHIRKTFEERSLIETRYKANHSGEWRFYDLHLIRSSDFAHTSEFTIAIIDSNDDVRLEEEQKQTAERTKMIEQASKNEGVFLINCEKNAKTTIQNNLQGSNNYTDKEKFSEGFRRYVTTYVADDDRREMLKYSSPAYILECLKDKEEISITYRDITSGAQRFYEMRLVKFSSTEVLQSFTKKDKETLDRLIYNKLKDDYFAFFTVDLDTGSIKIQKENFGYLMGEEGVIREYTPVIKEFSTTYTGEAKKFFERISSIDFIKQKFATEDKATFTFKSRKIKGAKWINVTGLVLTRHEDGTPSLFALGFNFADSMESNAKEIQEQIKEDMEVITGLASEYYALYYLNIEKSVFRIFSFDEKKFPETKQYIEKGHDPLDAFQKFGQSDLIHPDDRKNFKKITSEYVKEKLAQSKKFSIRFRRNFNSEYRWVEMDVIKYEDINEPANAIAVGFAIRDKEIKRERERTHEKDLANQQRHIKAFGDMVNVALWSIEINSDDEITSVFWSDEFRKMLGYENEKDFPNKLESWSSKLHPEDKERILSNFWESIKNKNAKELAYDVCYRILRNDKMYCWYHAMGRMENISGKSRRMYGVIKDISADKKLEEQLMLSDGLAREYHTVWLVEGKNKHKIHLFRSTGKKTIKSAVEFGIEDPFYDTSISKYIKYYVHEDDRERVLESSKFENVIRETPDVGTYVISYKRYCNEKRDIDYHQMCFAKAVADNGTVNYILAFRDADKMLREQLSQKNQLQNALSMAQSANKSKTNFLFNMSHDIRTPINAITGFTTMALKSLKDEDKVKNYLNKIDVSGQQLLMLINQVLEMSRIEAGKIEFDEKPINIRKSNESIITILAEQAKSAGLEFHHSISDVTHYKVLADEARMSQITLNIVSNAIKYTPKGGRIDMLFKENDCKKEGYASYTLSVIDTGIGMSKEFQKVLFEPFSREKSSTVSKIQGTGLGMSIVKSLVDILGGTIEVQSELGKGTRFDVTIEFKLNEKDNSVKTQRQKAVSAHFKGRKVLLVEDNEFNREIAKFILEENGLNVEEAEDGDIALQKIKELYKKGDYKYFDFILMDIQMPRMNGFDATKKIRQIPTPEGIHVPIIAITANAFEEDRQNAIDAGMDDHLAKPIDIEQLWKTLEKFV